MLQRSELFSAHVFALCSHIVSETKGARTCQLHCAHSQFASYGHMCERVSCGTFRPMKGVSMKHLLNLVRPTPRSPQKIMSRGHSHASETLASRACRNTSGIGDCACWRSAVVFVAFPSLFPLRIGTADTHSGECPQICGQSLGCCSPSPWWCPPTLAHFGAAR